MTAIIIECSIIYNCFHTVSFPFRATKIPELLSCCSGIFLFQA
nr:MAG TPA: hypothetical protein [Caudoviricetes sp.]